MIFIIAFYHFLFFLCYGKINAMKITKLLIFGILFAVFLFVGAEDAFAANWYVSRNGSNADGRSWTTAWNEMNRINWSSIQPGDIIYLDGGTSGLTYNTRMVSGAGGTASSPILIQRYEESGHNGRVSLAHGMEINHPYITVDGKDKRYFEIPPNSFDGYVVRVLNGGNFFTLRNVYIYGDQNHTGGELLYGGSYPLVRGLPNIIIQN